MSNTKSEFWAALGRMTFAEVLEVAEIFRDAWEASGEFEPTHRGGWSFLLNTARELTEQRAEDDPA